MSHEANALCRYLREDRGLEDNEACAVMGTAIALITGNAKKLEMFAEAMLKFARMAGEGEIEQRKPN